MVVTVNGECYRIFSTKGCNPPHYELIDENCESGLVSSNEPANSSPRSCNLTRLDSILSVSLRHFPVNRQ